MAKRGVASFVHPDDIPAAVAMAMMARASQGGTPVNIEAGADFMGPGAIEIARYQTEILDMVRRRLAFGQRILLSFSLLPRHAILAR